MAAACGSDAPVWRGQAPAVESLRRVWARQFAVDTGRARRRTDVDGGPPVRRFISSQYDVEARLGKKSTTTWIGHKVHLVETCEDETPHLIVHVTAAPAPAAEDEVTPAIHEELRDADLPPG